MISIYIRLFTCPHIACLLYGTGKQQQHNNYFPLSFHRTLLKFIRKAVQMHKSHPYMVVGLDTINLLSDRGCDQQEPDNVDADGKQIGHLPGIVCCFSKQLQMTGRLQASY